MQFKYLTKSHQLRLLITVSVLINSYVFLNSESNTQNLNFNTLYKKSVLSKEIFNLEKQFVHNFSSDKSISSKIKNYFIKPNQNSNSKPEPNIVKRKKTKINKIIPKNLFLVFRHGRRFPILLNNVGNPFFLNVCLIDS